VIKATQQMMMMEQTDVLDPICAEQAPKGFVYCETEGRCIDPTKELCRTPQYDQPTGLPACVRTAQAQCEMSYSGPSLEACRAGAEQAMRPPKLIPPTAMSSIVQFPRPFTRGMSASQVLCSTVST